MWQAIHMTIGSLATAARNHGAAPITIDEFAVIVDTTPAALRGRRDRDENFPAPINTNATPLTYLLRDLFEWWRRSTRNTTPRTVNRRALAEWTFNAAFEQCSARHGAEATHRLVAGASLILLERRHLITRTPADERLGLLRAHVATVRSSIRRNAIDRASFRADPIPATDGPFLASLLNWSGETGRSSGRDDTDVDDVGTPLIPDDSAEATRRTPTRLHDGDQRAAWARTVALPCVHRSDRTLHPGHRTRHRDTFIAYRSWPHATHGRNGRSTAG